MIKANVDKDTILNSTITQLDHLFGPVATQTQLTNVILDNIQEGRKKLKVYAPRPICSYPHPARKDDFNLQRGLGSVSLQPSIDALNNFKTNCINVIKTKIQAIGPPNVTGPRLGAGVIEVVAEVLQAAKCFTSIVTNVNNLISSNIEAVNFMVTQVTDKITQLTNEANTLKNTITNAPAEMLAVVNTELMKKLQSESNVFVLLALVTEIQNQINIAQMQLETLSHSRERITMHMEAMVMSLKSSLMGLKNALDIKNTMTANLIRMNDMYMVDNYLDDFNFGLNFKESSYSLSLTNSSAFTRFNMNDSMNLINKYNNMFKDYTTETVEAILIDRREESGYIVIPDDEDGILTCGMDARYGNSARLILELSINNGETIITCTTGEANDDGSIKPYYAYYSVRGAESFTYNENDGSKVYIKDTSVIADIVVGDYYIFSNPTNSSTIQFSFDKDGISTYFPVLYKVVGKSTNYVELEIQDSSTLKASQFISGAIDADYTYNDHGFDSLIGDADGNVTLFYKNPLSNEYYMNDQNGASLYNLDGTLVSQVFADDTAAQTWNDDESARAIDNLYAATYELNGITMIKYNFQDHDNKVPHADDKIKCENWTLTTYILGDKDVIRNIRFKREYPTDDLSLFFIKAHFGFISNLA